jgi:predicted Zn-dependent protease
MADSAAELFLLEAWVADNPGSRLFLKLAQAYKDAGRLDESAQVLERGLVMHPTMVEARQALAQVLEDKGDHNAALNQLMTAAAELCRHAGVFDGLARIWGTQGLDAEAQEARDLSHALAGALKGRVGSHLPAEPPSGMPAMPGGAAKPMEPPEPALTGPDAAKLLKHLDAMGQAARRRARG